MHTPRVTLYCGCSGFSYKEWKGTFYPARIKNDEMLRFYASHLDTVEINNTFYRMPRAAVLESWAAQVPESFRFVLKASRRITHQARLKDCADAVGYLWKNARTLGERLGPLLFQLPPYLRRDDERLAAFLDGLPQGLEAALEFRHASWFDPRVFDILRDHGAALCCADHDIQDDDQNGPPLVRTASFGYLRLRRASYDDGQLAEWRARIEAAGFDDTYVFFKHEEEGAAAKLAARMAGRDLPTV